MNFIVPTVNEKIHLVYKVLFQNVKHLPAYLKRMIEMANKKQNHIKMPLAKYVKSPNFIKIAAACTIATVVGLVAYKIYERICGKYTLICVVT